MQNRAALPRVLGLRDLILLHIVAIVGLRWLLFAGRTGPSSIILWTAAVVLFFIPQGLAVLEMSARIPEEGGLYVWAREAFGPLHGFVCGWAYWVNNLIYYPSLIVFVAGNAVFVLGAGHAGLADSPIYQVVFSLTVLWIVMGLNLIGLRTGRWVQNAGAVSNWTAALVLIGLAGLAWIAGRAHDPLAVGSLLPGAGRAELTSWSALCFALAGLELASVMGGEVRDPGRLLPRSILVAAPLIAAIYIVGTLAVLAIFPAAEVDVVTGIVEAIGVAGESFGLSLTRLAAVLIVLTGLGGIGAWLAGTARIPFVAGLDRYLPPALGRIHPRWKTPHIALLIQGVGASLFIVLSAIGSADAEEAYRVLVDTTIIVYFVPYLYLFAALPRLRARSRGGSKGFTVPGGRPGLYAVAVSGFVTTLVSIVLATLPTEDVASPLLFVAKVVGGAGLLLGIGLVIYYRSPRGARQR